MSEEWKAIQGECLLIPSGPNGSKHLFTILIDPTIFPNYGSKPHILSVNITTIRPNIQFDEACILEAGEHPFITHRSYVNYRAARFEPAENLEKLTEQGYLIRKDSCTDELLNKIIAGAQQSRFISREYKVILRQLQ